MAGLFEAAVIGLLILANGLFSMSEFAIVSARRHRLQTLAESGDVRAGTALGLAAEPNRFLSTVQIGITVIGVLSGAYGGAVFATALAELVGRVPLLAPYASTIAFAAVVLLITYLTLVIGEIVPKRLALANPEPIALRVARPMRVLSVVSAPAVALLSASTELVLRLVGAKERSESPVTEEEVGRAALQAFQLGEQLGDVEHLALGDELVLVHIAQRAGRVARHIHPVWPGGEWNAEASVTGGEGFSVEIVVGCHVQPAQVY